VTISSLVDDVLREPGRQGQLRCAADAGPGASYSCSFTARVSGNAGSSHTDVVTASGTDDDGNPVSGHDDATVTITDVGASIEVTKSGRPDLRPGAGRQRHLRGDREEHVGGRLGHDLEPHDDVYGNLDGKGTCDVPSRLRPA
jgi:hypothetical protein